MDCADQVGEYQCDKLASRLAVVACAILMRMMAIALLVANASRYDDRCMKRTSLAKHGLVSKRAPKLTQERGTSEVFLYDNLAYSIIWPSHAILSARNKISNTDSRPFHVKWCGPFTPLSTLRILLSIVHRLLSFPTQYH